MATGKRVRAASKPKGSGRKQSGAGDSAKADNAAPYLSREILALALIMVALYLFVSGLSYSSVEPGASANWGGAVGHHLAGFFLCSFGLPSFLFFAFGLYWGLLLLLGRKLRSPGTRAFGATALMLVFTIFLGGSGSEAANARLPYGLGGHLGALIAPKMHASFGGVGAVMLLLLTAAIAFFVAADWAFRDFVADLRSAWVKRQESVASRRQADDFSPLHTRISQRLSRGFAAFLQLGPAIAQFFRRAQPLPALAEAGDEGVSEGPLIRGPLIQGPETQGPEIQGLGRSEEPKPKRGRRKAAGKPAAEAAEIAEPALENAAETPAQTAAEEHAPAEQAASSEAAGEEVALAKKPKPRPRSPRIYRQTPQKPKARKRPAEPLPGGADYEYPPFDLLAAPDFGDEVASEATLKERAEAIERRLKNHKVTARVVQISAGPAVTVFELEVDEGQRIASLTRFAPDLAAALKALSVRIVAPIPGKHTVGVEVPNEKRSFVRLRELLEAEDCSKHEIPLCLGRDVAGKVMVEDLARMPHLLIAGATGSGKSVCINSILLSIMVLKSPAECRLILIDPKMVELQNYASIPHLMCPVVTNMKKAGGVLAWAVETMEKRYALLSAVGVRKLADYNALGEAKLKKRLGLRYDPEETPPQLPKIVLVIDEFADLMSVAAAEIEVSIQRLAQKSRAVGIHVILATQRPSRDVITGLIKANLPTRIAFQVSNRIDSRVILDANGADQLLGHGDMLYIPPGTNRLVRAQGSYVSDDEIHDVVEFLEEKVGRQVFEQELMQSPTGSNRSARDRDDLFDKAVRVVLEEQRGSATLLQRKLSVGYTRASRLIELMEEEGVVGMHKGSKSREVMMSLEEWEAMHGPPAPECEQGDLFAQPNDYAPEPLEEGAEELSASLEREAAAEPGESEEFSGSELALDSDSEVPPWEEEVDVAAEAEEPELGEEPDEAEDAESDEAWDVEGVEGAEGDEEWEEEGEEELEDGEEWEWVVEEEFEDGEATEEDEGLPADEGEDEEAIR